MNKKSFKIILMLLVLTLLVGVVGGCVKKEKNNVEPSSQDMGDIGDTGGLKLPITDKPVDISIFLESEFPDGTESWAVKELSRRTGVNIEIIEAPLSSINEKAKVIIGSGKLPDIMETVVHLSEINDLGMQDAYVPINKYADQLPNFKNIFVDNEENNWILKSGAAPDGNLYYWPKYECERDVNHGFLYRKDIFDKHEIDEWSNPEEFYLALKKLKEIYPESLPYASKTKESIFKNWSTSWGLAAPGPYYDQNEKQWKLSSTDPKYKEMLDFMKKLYKEELIDSEFLTDTQASWIAKMTQPEKSFVTFDWIGRLDSFYEMVKETMPEYDLRYTYPIGPTGNVIPTSKVGISYGLMVANNDKSEIALKLIDYLASPSGAELMTMGSEGQTYTKTTDGKIKYIGFPEDKQLGIKDLEEKYGLFKSGAYMRMDKRSIYFNYTEKEQEAQDKIINENRFRQRDPMLPFNNDEQKIVNDYLLNLNKATEEFSTRYILEESTGESDWNEWLNRAKSLGEEQLIEVYNAAQEKFDN